MPLETPNPGPHRRSFWVSTVFLALPPLLAVVTVVFGSWGYWEHLHRQARETPGTPQPQRVDVLYRAVQLLVLQTDSIHPGEHLPNKLWVARFTGALFPITTILVAFGRLIAAWCRALRFATVRNHVVVAGLGTGGGRLVEQLRENGNRVVVVEANGTHPDLPRCRAVGAVVIAGTPADVWPLRWARVHRASRLLSLFQSDAENVATAVAARELLRGTGGRPIPLRCVVRLTDPGLHSVLARHPLIEDTHDSVDVEVFDAIEATARAMVRATASLRPPGPGETPGGVGPDGSPAPGRTMWVVGLDDRLGEAVVVRAAKDWLIDGGGVEAGSPLTVVVVDPAADEKVRRLTAHYPDLLRAGPVLTHGPGVHTHFLTSARLPAARPDAVFVTLADEVAAVTAADRLRGLFRGQPSVAVVLRTTETGLGSLFRDQPGESGGVEVIPVGVEDQVLGLATAESLRRELLAEAFHLRYFWYAAKPGAAPAAGWKMLAEFYKTSNRELADSIDAKLGRAGLRTVYAPHEFITPLPLEAQDLVEDLAREEHGRWWKFMERNGWQLGARNDGAKTHPNLLPWKELPPDKQDIDRMFVRVLPAVLAKADYKLVSVGPPGEQPVSQREAGGTHVE